MGGAHGRLVEVIEADDQGGRCNPPPAWTNSCAGRAVAVLGAINSSPAPWRSWSRAPARVPLPTSSSTATQVTALDNKWVFRCIESDYFRMAELSRYLTEELSPRRIGILYDNDDFGRGLMADFHAQPRTAQSRTRLCPAVSARSGGLQRGAAGDSAAGNRGARPVRHHPRQHPHRDAGPGAAAAGPALRPRRHRALPHQLEEPEGLVATDHFLLQEKPAARLFAARYKTRFETAAGPHAGRAYDAACILLQAIRRTPDPRREALRDAISATENFPASPATSTSRPTATCSRRSRSSPSTTARSSS